MAVLDARLAGQDAGAQALLSDLDAGHRLRHHLLLGRPHDDDGPALHERGAVPRRLHPPPGARRDRRQDVEVEGQRLDPLGVIDDYGADALRFTLARNVAPGHDIRLGPQDVENNRNFATKLWNAARFVEFNGAARVEGFDPKSAKETLNRWIAHETAKAAAEITQAIEAYAFNEAAGAAYRFVWNVYCDWYVELSKPLLTGPDGAAKDETRAMAAWALDEILKLLHPFMPFITEELWAVTAEQGPKRKSAGAERIGRSSKASPTTRPKPRSAG